VPGARMIDGPLEVCLRRSCRTAHARAGSNRATASVFHACVWETAKHGCGLILFGSAFCCANRWHAPFIWAHLRDDPGEARAYRAAQPQSVADRKWHAPRCCWGNATARSRVFVIRDPRALLATWITFKPIYATGPTRCAWRTGR